MLKNDTSKRLDNFLKLTYNYVTISNFRFGVRMRKLLESFCIWVCLIKTTQSRQLDLFSESHRTKILDPGTSIPTTNPPPPPRYPPGTPPGTPCWESPKKKRKHIS